jgi:hypothetical protein
MSAPQFEYDLLAPNSWSEREAAGRGEARQWDAESLSGVNFHAPAPTRSLSRQLAPGALETAQKIGTVWRLSSRREFPQLELHAPLPNPRQADATQFFDTLRALAEKMSNR